LKKRDLRRSELADRYVSTIIPKMEAKESETIKLALVNLRRKQEAEEKAINLQREKQR
jgi:hypothetical protein